MMTLNDQMEPAVADPLEASLYQMECGMCVLYCWFLFVSIFNGSKFSCFSSFAFLTYAIARETKNAEKRWKTLKRESEDRISTRISRILHHAKRLARLDRLFTYRCSGFVPKSLHRRRHRYYVNLASSIWNYINRIIRCNCWPLLIVAAKTAQFNSRY